MRLSIRRIFVFILFSIIFSSIFFNLLVIANGNSQKIDVAHNKTIQEFIINDSNNNIYPLISFWQLPLWVQITYIFFTLLALAGLIKAIPFIFGRLKHALENPKTREIFYFIQRNPGITIAELSDEQKINRGTLKYHLSQLLSNNKIIFIKKGKFARLFYNTSSPMDKESIISLYLKNENSCRILLKIMDNPGISNQELSDGFDLAKSTTHEYLKNFYDDGIVEFRQDGKYKRCYLKQDARMIMLRYRPQ
jgi:predicted transcriptional regulator